ncbi:hypothetical protein B808_1046 [Fructilactobacillus florum 8D]|uniref:Uncharacterized protein n=1 Tax=Fructilactobacillus florum 8D TaxID=1221538 RepID=W9EDA9_9LACO|nr:hypothetical protein B808_1046 [Fructilactobacillus florum 8D]
MIKSTIILNMFPPMLRLINSSYFSINFVIKTVAYQLNSVINLV